jgi:hypothetical protein
MSGISVDQSSEPADDAVPLAEEVAPPRVVADVPETVASVKVPLAAEVAPPKVEVDEPAAPTAPAAELAAAPRGDGACSGDGRSAEGRPCYVAPRSSAVGSEVAANAVVDQLRRVGGERPVTEEVGGAYWRGALALGLEVGVGEVRVPRATMSEVRGWVERRWRPADVQAVGTGLAWDGACGVRA